MLSWFILVGIIAGFMIGTYYLYHFWVTQKLIEEGVIKIPKKLTRKIPKKIPKKLPGISKKAYEYAYQKLTKFQGEVKNTDSEKKQTHNIYAFHALAPGSTKGESVENRRKEGLVEEEGAEEMEFKLPDSQIEDKDPERDKEIVLRREEVDASVEYESDQVEVLQIHQSEEQRKGGFRMSEIEQVDGLELIKAPVVVGENLIQRMLVSDLPLAMTAVKVREIVARVESLETDVIADKVIIQGIVHKQIFYVAAADNVIHHQAENIEFSFFVEIPGAEPGMDVFVEPTVEHVVSQLIADGDILHQKVVIQFFVKVLTKQQLIVETGAADRFPLFKVERVIGDNTVQTLVINDVTLATPAEKIVDINAEVVDLVVDIIEDKVIIQGVIHKQLFFIGTDELEHHQAEDIPFSEFIDIPGAEPGMNVQIHPTIEHIKQELGPGGTTVLQEIVLELFAKVTQTIQVNLVPGNDSLVLLPEVIGENMRQILSETTVTLANPAIKIKEIVASIINLNTVVINNKVIIQGLIHKQIFYIGTDDIEYHQQEEVPFSTFVEVIGTRPGMNVDVTPTVTFVKPILTPGEALLTQKVIADLFVKVTNDVQFNVSEVGPYGV